MAKRDTGAEGKSAPETNSEAARPAEFAVHEHIGRQLRGIFDEIVTQPVPEKFRELLDELERKQADRKPK